MYLAATVPRMVGAIVLRENPQAFAPAWTIAPTMRGTVAARYIPQPRLGAPRLAVGHALTGRACRGRSARLPGGTPASAGVRAWRCLNQIEADHSCTTMTGRMTRDNQPYLIDVAIAGAGVGVDSHWHQDWQLSPRVVRSEPHHLGPGVAPVPARALPGAVLRGRRILLLTFSPGSEITPLCATLV